MDDRFLTDLELAQRLPVGLTKNSVRNLRVAGKIPFLKLGYRTFRYNLDAVVAALNRFEIKAISGRPLDGGARQKKGKAR
jgi:hypothetical protein